MVEEAASIRVAITPPRWPLIGVLCSTGCFYSPTGSPSTSTGDPASTSGASTTMDAMSTAAETEGASITDSDGTPTTGPGDDLWCEDVDGDGFGDPLQCLPDMFPGSVPNGDDCDDDDPDTFPGAAENESDALCQKDADQDGWGDDTPPPGVEPGTDCADANAELHEDCVCPPDTAACDGDDLRVCNAEGTLEEVATCEYGCDDIGLKCWDALTVDAGPSVCAAPGLPVQLSTTVSGGDGAYAYMWTPTNTLDDPASQEPQATPTGVTLYTVAVGDGEGNMAADEVSVFVDGEVLSLDPEVCTVHDFPHEFNAQNNDPVAAWQWNEDAKELCETLNAKGSALFCGWTVDNATITGTFGVKTNLDDDWIGFMWGIQDTSHFYIFSWKQLGQFVGFCGNIQVPGGMQVKVVDVQDPMSAPLECIDLLAPQDTANSRLLVAVDDFTTAGYADDVDYTFQLTHRTGGEMTIVVRRADDDSLVAQTTFIDETYARGSFGMYTKSQANSCFSGFTVSCEP